MIRTFWRFRAALRPYRFPLWLGTLFVLLLALTDIATPWPLKFIVDNVLRGRHLSSAWRSILGPAADSSPDVLLGIAVGAFLVIVGISALADYLSTLLLDGVGERLTADLRDRMFAHLQRLSLRFHDRQRVGDLTTRITSDVGYVEDMLVASLSVLIPNVLVLAGIVVVMFVVDPGFAGIALAVAPFLFWTVLSFRLRIKRASKQARRKDSELASIAQESLSSMRLVQVYTGEPHHIGRFRERNVERLSAGLQAIELQAKLGPVVDVIGGLGTATVLWLGARRVLHHQMTLGLLLVFVSYLSQLYKPMRNLSKLAWVVSRGQASAERIHEVISADERVVERPEAVPAPRLAGALGVRSVTFGYGPDEPVLHDVSVEAASGETIALAGPTGAGKSTLVSLIPRLYDPWEGEVLLDGRDVREFTVSSLRQQVALVLQDSILFHGSIYDNIVYGREGASRDEVLSAAEAAYVDEFVRGLPDGYDTVVAERGVSLSGGQRQRIAIARALVRDAPIVILDEPTSGLDAISERYVMRGLDRLMHGRTVIVVAHRLSTLRNAHRVYVVEAGRIVDVGTHDQLTERPGLYREMHTALTGRVASFEE